MPDIQVACPHCGAKLSFAQPIAAGAALRCLMCQKTFAVAAAATAGPPVARPPAPARSGERTPAVPATAPRRSPPAAAPPTAPAASHQRVLVGVLSVGIVLVLSSGLVLVLWKGLHRTAPPPEELPAPLASAPLPAKAPAESTPLPAKAPTGGTQPPVVEPAKKDPKVPAAVAPKDVDLADLPPSKKTPPPALPEVSPKRVDPPPEPPVKPGPEVPAPPSVPVVVPPAPIAPGVDRAAVDAAIERGVVYLKQQPLINTGFGVGGGGVSHQVGYAALAGLALLECQVPANDPVIERAAQLVRAQTTGLTQTYDLSAAILFLDRLGASTDHDLIQRLGLRLLAGQTVSGGWNYYCPVLTDDKSAQLQRHLLTYWPWSPTRPRPSTAVKGKDGKQAPLPAIDLKHLNPQQLAWFPNKLAAPGTGDNSNTQFALLALRAVRRHDVPVECPILLSYQRFLDSQKKDGGWGYVYAPVSAAPGPQLAPAPGLPNAPPRADGMADVMNSKPTMTCVGLLGLAMGNGVVPGAKTDLKDQRDHPAIAKGLALVGKSVGTPAPAGPTKGLPMQNLYLLWSIERVAVLYDLKTIGGKDWYGWGAQTLLANQTGAGNWTGGQYLGSNDALDTCFALLFLKRSNLVPELTENLRLRMVIRDPGARK